MKANHILIDVEYIQLLVYYHTYSSTQYFHIYIRKNGGMLSYVHGSTSSYEEGSCSFIEELVTGDQIDVFIPNTYAATSQGAGTFFNGYMIG